MFNDIVIFVQNENSMRTVVRYNIFENYFFFKVSENISKFPHLNRVVMK